MSHSDNERPPEQNFSSRLSKDWLSDSEQVHSSDLFEGERREWLSASEGGGYPRWLSDSVIDLCLAHQSQHEWTDCVEPPTTPFRELCDPKDDVASDEEMDSRALYSPDRQGRQPGPKNNNVKGRKTRWGAWTSGIGRSIGLGVQDIGLLLGVLAFIPFLFLQIGDGPKEDQQIRARVAGVIVLMGVCWVTEGLPIPATALIPIFLFPLLCVMSSDDVTALYFNDTIALFIATNIVGLAMQKYRLHERVALRILLLVGESPRKIVGGVMAVTATLSMFMSNTATTTVMAPFVVSFFVSLQKGPDIEQSPLLLNRENKPKEVTELPTMSSIIEQLNRKEKSFLKAALLGTAYSANVGGTATIIGTGTNLAFKSIFSALYPEAPGISFGTWMIFALPFVIICLVVIWLWLVFLYMRDTSGVRVSVSAMKEQYRKLGPMAVEEWIVAAVLVIMMILWLTRTSLFGGIPGWADLFEILQDNCGVETKIAAPGDSVVAVGGALSLFVLPQFARNPETGRSRPLIGTRMMDWKDCKSLSWGIALLLGAGYALASAMMITGLSASIGSLLSVADALPIIVFLWLSGVLVAGLSEFMSNVAMANIVLPIVANLAVAQCENPLVFMIPVTIACSLVFMMPAATPPNAIVFSYQALKVSEMVRTGVFLDFGLVTLLTLWSYFLIPPIWDVQYGEVPYWVNQQDLPPKCLAPFPSPSPL